MESNTYYLTQLLENKFIRKLIAKACADKHQIDFHYACDFITTWCPNVDSAVMQIKFSFSSLNYADDLWSLKCSLSLDCQHVYKEFMIKLLIWAVHLCPTQKYLKMAWVFFWGESTLWMSILICIAFILNGKGFMFICGSFSSYVQGLDA